LTLTWDNDVAFWNLGLNAYVDAYLSNSWLGLRSTKILSLYGANMFSASIAVSCSCDYVQSYDLL